MSGLIQGFKDCAHQAGTICSIPEGKQIRVLGLGDFLENRLREEDDAPTIAVKALQYFCEGLGPQHEAFKYAVLTVGIFLNDCHKPRRPGVPQQALKDLVAILTGGGGEAQVRGWIDSHFG